MNTNLSGKLALITGAEAGLGRQIALRLANDGADIILHYVFDQHAAEETAREINEMGRQAYLIRADFFNINEIDAMFQQIHRIGTTDILINNAGALFQRLSFLEEDSKKDELWEKSFQINYMSVVRTMRELIPPMCQQGWGRVINISSVSCRIRTRTGATVHYSPMKSAVETLTVHVSDEVAQYGVTCNCVGPGNMKTKLVSEAPLPDPDILRLYHTRRGGTSEEVAATVEYLASPDASFVTGEVFYTSGGR